jgi:hypothetical protein
MVTKRLRRRLASGEERTYIYEVHGEERQSLGIPTSPDHTQWIDATPLLGTRLMMLVIVRFLGLGFNSTGGIITVSVGIVRLLLSSLPPQSGRLGR